MNENNNEQDVMEEVNEIIEGLEDSNTQTDIDHIRNEDPMKGLRISLLNFIENRLTVVNEEESFRKAVKDALLMKIQGGEASMAQLTDLLKTVDRDTIQAVESILSLLRPGQHGESSPLFNNSHGGSSDEIPRGFEDLSPEQTEVLQKLTMVVQALEREGK